MSRRGTKKTLRQRRKSQQRKKHQPAQQHPTLIAPDIPAERIGVPAGAASWLGQKIASWLKIR
ncbi:hypothetical protein KDH_76940 [Dictyobacter sp. S3.2.2.5]|uniref:Uncharacterized protein n=1 Tax=Dictyobacter halimunensis TaxID=3026934 RepID=A0ABQ6G5M5_9CHLR|nr:hypothetical protein KDH_76940 [Dictyobacter sp. S3.2.2.5]